MTSTDTQIALRLERQFDYPPERVFDAWTDPDVLREWWAAGPDWDTPFAELDLRVGGRYRLAMRDPESGAQHTVGGEYIKIERPTRIEYTWQWEPEPGIDANNVSIVEVDFKAAGTGTLVVLTHRGFESEDSRDRHDHGWKACLENLGSRVLS